jgi:hypothetical protein
MSLQVGQPVGRAWQGKEKQAQIACSRLFLWGSFYAVIKEGNMWKLAIVIVVDAVAALLFLTLLMPSAAWAQQPATSFGELRSKIRIGDDVEVTEYDGKNNKGRITDLTSTSLSLDNKGIHTNLTEMTVQEVRKHIDDSLWNVVLVGIGSGAAAGAVIGTVWCSDCQEPWLATLGGLVVGAPIGAGTGALIDLFIRRFDRVYMGPAKLSDRRFHVLPILSKTRRGVEIALSF